MNSTGHKVILLLAIGLTAFSSAMKELNQIQQLSLEASGLVARWSERVAPAEVPQVVVPQTAIKAESCESKQSKPSVELPWLDHVAQIDVTDKDETVSVVKRSAKSRIEAPKLTKSYRFNIDPMHYEVRTLDEHVESAPAVPMIPDFSFSSVKAKSRRNGTIRISTRDREILLKTLNRSINLRIAS